MSYSIEIVRADGNAEHAPSRAMPERYETIEAAIRAADTELQMIGAPGSLVYRILDEAGQPVPVPGGAAL